MIEQGGGALAIECKSGQTLSDESFDNLRFAQAIGGDAIKQSFLVYGGDDSHQRSSASVLGWRDLGTLPLVF